ncbi:hypothetical protein C8D87_101355 [Lentzea atacamensis]|uniref:(2Fe-2S) ferredoxin domain-containing protein n=1 Tax=Lentzea atacamensis TaxID=531938 RepID=A0ABX9EFV3_9PSEU|nr:hypothetical protein [Lentzea atacamensis]RAS70055.1 hypothetical protein C8D87_101355 [Lentzea atacamensis]
MNRLTVCRGCCCGTEKKHPDVDHESQLTRLRAAVGAHRVLVADCLDSCDFSNVVVVRPDTGARQAGARPVWLGGVLSDEVVDGIVGWIADGGPGRAPVPDVLAPNVIARPADQHAS